MKTTRRLVIGVTGASGAVYALRALEALADSDVETHLVMSRASEMTIRYELNLSGADFAKKADYRYTVGDIAAPIASGSFKTIGMLIAPCSVKTMSEIATGVTSTLLTRAREPSDSSPTPHRCPRSACRISMAGPSPPMTSSARSRW